MIKMTPCMSVWCAQKNPFSSVRLRMLRVSILFYPELRFSGSALNFCLYLYVHDGKLLQPPFILGNAYFCGILLPVTTAWIFTSWLPFLYIFLELLFFFFGYLVSFWWSFDDYKVEGECHCVSAFLARRDFFGLLLPARLRAPESRAKHTISDSNKNSQISFLRWKWHAE